MPPWLPGFLLVGDWGDPHPTTQKIVFPPLLCPKNVDYVIFMQFLAILPKLSPPQVDPIWETLFDAKVKILKTCLSGLAEIAFLPSFFYQVSCFSACLYYVQDSLHSQGTESLVSQFPR